MIIVIFIYVFFSTEDKSSVTDFLPIEKEKTIRISIINDAQSDKEKCWCFFHFNIDIRQSLFPFCMGVGRRPPPSKLQGEGGRAAAPPRCAFEQLKK